MKVFSDVLLLVGNNKPKTWKLTSSIVDITLSIQSRHAIFITRLAVATPVF